jgi:alpha-L-rhamnosidase
VAAWEAPRAPLSVTPLAAPAGAFVFDFGVNVAGRCTLTLRGPTPAGARVTLLHGETLHANGSVLVGFACPCACCADGGNCANQSFTFITAGAAAGADETYRPTFAYSGFRWVQVDGWPAGAPAPTAAALSCVATSSAVEATGSVSFGGGAQSRVLDGVQALVVRTQRSNLASIPTDCPQREKRGWMADASVSADEAALNFDMQLLYENWLRTHADTAAVGCGPLPENATCPKWHPDQPAGGGGAAAAAHNPYAAVAAGAEPFPNCTSAAPAARDSAASQTRQPTQRGALQT